LSPETHERPDPDRDRATTRRGLAVLGWLVLTAVLTSVVAEGLGLRTATSPSWPTDVHAWTQRPPGPPPDVVILGSSRASFDLTPASIDACLSSSLGRPTTTVNLARTFATANSYARTWRTLLDTEASRPSLLLIGVGPEAFDDHNPMLPSRLRLDVPLAEVPRELAGVSSAAELIAVLRAPVRGVESLVRMVVGRHRKDARLRWLMVHHGGGQWCEGSGACTRQNATAAAVNNRWPDISPEHFDSIPDERFGAYTIDGGRVAAAMDELLDDAASAGTEVVLVRLPLHDDFREAIPPEHYAAYIAHTDQLATRPGVTLFDAHKPQVTRDKRAWIDPDHLAPRPSMRLSRELCRTTLLPLLQGDDTAPSAGGR
jgi:hypothetical protein